MGCNHSTDASDEAADTVTRGAIPNLVNQTKDGLQKFVGKGQQHQGRNVFARPIEFILAGGPFAPPIFPKNADEEAFLRDSLPKNFVFENLEATELSMLVSAMEQISIEKSQQIIKQGDEGDFFYVIYKGTVNFIVNDKIVGSGAEGDSFGELSLLYTTPRAATVKATSACTLYRVDQKVFRHILQHQTVSAVNEKTDILKQVAFLKDLGEHAIDKLALVLTPAQFKAGEVIMRKNDTNADLFYILQQGTVKCTEVGAGTSKYEDTTLNKAGDYFGERALVTGEPRAATVTAITDTLCFTIDKKTFENVLGEFKKVILKSQDRSKLVRLRNHSVLMIYSTNAEPSVIVSPLLSSQAAIKIIAESKLTTKTLTSLAQKLEEMKFAPGSFICKANMPTNASLYLIRTGTVTIEEKGQLTTIGPGGFFGDDQLQADKSAGGNFSVTSPARANPTYSAKAGNEEVTAGVLTLKACRRLMDTRHIGDPLAGTIVVVDSIVERGIALKDLERHTILGAGTFGQVWLVSRKKSDGKRVAYALKIQSKYELVHDGQATAVVYEKNIMAQLHHPFLIGLVNTYQDEHFVYILLQLVQGGELYNYIHTKKSNFLHDKDAKFYAACIATGLGFMHRRSFVYRDLKPEVCPEHRCRVGVLIFNSRLLLIHYVNFRMF